MRASSIAPGLVGRHDHGAEAGGVVGEARGTAAQRLQGLFRLARQQQGAAQYGVRARRCVRVEGDGLAQKPYRFQRLAPRGQHLAAGGARARCHTPRPQGEMRRSTASSHRFLPPLAQGEGEGQGGEAERGIRLQFHGQPRKA
jgi:hypothetical protein